MVSVEPRQEWAGHGVSLGGWEVVGGAGILWVRVYGGPWGSIEGSVTVHHTTINETHDVVPPFPNLHLRSNGSYISEKNEQIFTASGSTHTMMAPF